MASKTKKLASLENCFSYKLISFLSAKLWEKAKDANRRGGGGQIE